MKKSPARKVNSIIIFISVLIFGLFIYRKMAMSPVEINEIGFIYPKDSPSPTPRTTPSSTPISTQYPKPSPSPTPVMTTPPPNPSPTSLPFPEPTMDPFASITCQAKIYKTTYTGSPNALSYGYDWHQYIRPENLITTQVTVKGGEFFLVYPKINNVTSNYLQTLGSFQFRSQPQSGAKYATTLFGHGDYYSFTTNDLNLVHLGKLQIGPNNGSDHTDAYFVYYIRAGRNASFKFTFDIVGPNIQGTYSEPCGSLTVLRRN